MISYRNRQPGSTLRLGRERANDGRRFTRERLDGMIPLPHIAEPLKRARQRAENVPLLDGLEAASAANGAKTSRKDELVSACGSGERGEKMAAFIAPIADQLDLSAAEVADAAAWAANLVAGGMPRRRHG